VREIYQNKFERKKKREKENIQTHVRWIWLETHRHLFYPGRCGTVRSMDYRIYHFTHHSYQIPVARPNGSNVMTAPSPPELLLLLLLLLSLLLLRSCFIDTDSSRLEYWWIYCAFFPSGVGVGVSVAVAVDPATTATAFVSLHACLYLYLLS